MKDLFTLQHPVTSLFLFILICLVLSGCQKKEEPEMAPDNWLDNSYSGTLTVHYTSVYPAWDVSATMVTWNWRIDYLNNDAYS